MQSFTTLIDVATLAPLLDADELALFDCRSELGNPAWGESEYAQGHIPGALYLHLDRDLSSPITATSGRHPLPDPATFARALAALGVRPESQLIAYDQGNGAYAARLWWLARWIGIRDVAVLDGGIAARTGTTRTAAGRARSAARPQRRAGQCRGRRAAPSPGKLAGGRARRRTLCRTQRDHRPGRRPCARRAQPAVHRQPRRGRKVPCARVAASALPGTVGVAAALRAGGDVRLWRHCLPQ